MRSNRDGSPQVCPSTGLFIANVMNSLEVEAAPSRMRTVQNSLANRRTTGNSRNLGALHGGRVSSRAGFVGGLLVVLLFFFAPASSFAEAGGSWTNRAGHALKASPQSISGQSVTFVQERTGKTVTYPISVFKETEQERLRCCLKDPTLPEGLKAAYEFSARVITRSRLLKASGGLSEADCQKAMDDTVSAFRTQAAPFIAQKQISAERLEMIARDMVAEKK